MLPETNPAFSVFIYSDSRLDLRCSPGFTIGIIDISYRYVAIEFALRRMIMLSRV